MLQLRWLYPTLLILFQETGSHQLGFRNHSGYAARRIGRKRSAPGGGIQLSAAKKQRVQSKKKAYVYVCPFLANDPDKHGTCFGHDKFDTYSRVVQHLRVSHRHPIFRCSKCGETVCSDENAQGAQSKFDDHVRGCNEEASQSEEKKLPWGVIHAATYTNRDGDEEKKKLMKELDTDDKKWFWTYDALFGADSSRPGSPYHHDYRVTHKSTQLDSQAGRSLLNTIAGAHAEPSIGQASHQVVQQGWPRVASNQPSHQLRPRHELLARLELQHVGFVPPCYLGPASGSGQTNGLQQQSGHVMPSVSSIGQENFQQHRESQFPQAAPSNYPVADLSEETSYQQSDYLSPQPELSMPADGLGQGAA